MRISEIYCSIQGESTYTGWPCVFLRTAGCALRCVYCDTEYALDPEAGEAISLDEIVDRVRCYGVDLVEITGGEPLEQTDTPELCQRLLDLGLKVLVETNGAHRIDMLPKETIKIIDLKTPGSRMDSHNDWNNIPLLSPKDEVKFVLLDQDDFDWAVRICVKHELFNSVRILFSPIVPALKPADLAQWILDMRIPVCLQIQIHKIIWPESERGV